MEMATTRIDLLLSMPNLDKIRAAYSSPLRGTLITRPSLSEKPLVILPYTVLRYIILYSMILYYTILYVYYTILYYTILN